MARSKDRMGAQERIELKARKRELRELERELGIIGTVETMTKSLYVREEVLDLCTRRRGSVVLIWARLFGEVVLIASKQILTNQQARRWERVATKMYDAEEALEILEIATPGE